MKKSSACAILLSTAIVAIRIAPPTLNGSLIEISLPNIGNKLGSGIYFGPVPGLREISLYPSTAHELKAAVSADYLHKFPPAVEPVWSVTNIKIDHHRQLLEQAGSLLETDIHLPDIQTCRPKLSAVVPLTEGIFCGDHEESCAITRLIKTSQTYTTSQGMRLTANVSSTLSSIDIKTFSVTASFTSSPSYSQIWGSPNCAPETSYTWTLKPNTFCTPSMVHVELECDLGISTYWWDSTFYYKSRNVGRARHLTYGNRQEEAMAYGDQYCHSSIISTAFFTSHAARAELWRAVVEDDPDRGFVYLGRNSDVSPYLSETSEGVPKPFREAEIIIRRNFFSPQTVDERRLVFRCDPARKAGKGGVMKLPIVGTGGALQGFVACVGEPSPEKSCKKEPAHEKSCKRETEHSEL